MEVPIYREAYPRLDVFQARLSNRMKEIDFNRWLCRFRIGETGFAGELVILARTDSSVVIDYFMRGAEHRYGGGQVHLSLADAPNGIDPTRQFFRCDDCQRARAVLAFKRGAWLCCDCHELCYRSQLIDTQVRLREELAEVDARIPRGRRPKHMHGRTFRKLQKRWAELQKQCAELQKRRGPIREASEAHRKVIRAEWIEVAKVDHINHPGYEKAGDIFVRAVRPSWAEAPTAPAPAPAPAPAKPEPESSPHKYRLGPVGKSPWFDQDD